MPLLWVEGEISNFARPASGHWYFTLKDQQAQIRCAMFRNRNGLASIQPGNGQQVLVRCRVSIYEGRGDYQLIVEHLEDAGLGALQRKFDQLKIQLQQEGLFDPAHKQPLPAMPQHIGVITSPTGAAIRDILTVLKRRFPTTAVTIYPAQVQGAEAAPQIIQAIEQANRQQSCDALIVGRGGGSLEDLWAFNEEAVARAIFASTIPVVSAVGHEVDYTIADFVADARAATPSAAAEMLSPDGRELAASFQGFEQLLSQAAQRQINNACQQLDALSKRLRHPGERIADWHQQLDHMEARLKHSAASRVEQRQSTLNSLVGRLNRHHPQDKLQQFSIRTRHLRQRMDTAMAQILRDKQSTWESTSQLLHAVSPLNTLERGYAIVRDSENHLVRQVKDVSPGDIISAKLRDGSLLCTVNNSLSDKTEL